MKKFRYLVAYVDVATGVFANCAMTRVEPIQTMADVAEVVTGLTQQYGLIRPVLLSFSRFDDPVSTVETS